jgi:diguanylate cyclase (GGDEF)-like protein
MQVSSERILCLSRFTATFTELHSLDRAGEIVCAAAMDLLSADGASVLLSDGCGRYPRYSTAKPGHDSGAGALELSAGGWALCHRCPVIVPDVAQDPRTPGEVYGPMQTESLVAVPIGGDLPSAPFGAIESHWLGTHAASQEEVQLLQLLAGLTALGLRGLMLRNRLEVCTRLRTTDQEAMSRRLLKGACERRQAEETAHRLALTDELTGLYNRRGLFELGVPLLRAGRSCGCPVYVLYADIDGLKVINDTHGHEAGDRLIQNAARSLQGALRAQDLLSRVGGDEFCAVLAGSQGDGSVFLERLARLATSDPASGIPSLSFGLARDDGQPSTDMRSLIQRADHVMYALKRWRKSPSPRPVRAVA